MIIVAGRANLARVWRDPSHDWQARSASVLVVIAIAIVIWTQVSMRVFNPSLIH